MAKMRYGKRWGNNFMVNDGVSHRKTPSSKKIEQADDYVELQLAIIRHSSTNNFLASLRRWMDKRILTDKQIDAAKKTLEGMGVGVYNHRGAKTLAVEEIMKRMALSKKGSKE